MQQSARPVQYMLAAYFGCRIGQNSASGLFFWCVCVCLCVGVRATGRNCPSTCTTMDYGLQNIRRSICYRCKTLCFNVNCVCEATAFKISLDRPG